MRISRVNTIFQILVIPSLLFLAIGLYKIDKYLNWMLYSLILVFFGCFLGLLVIIFLDKSVENKLNKKEIKEYKKHHFPFKIILLSVFICFGGGVLLGESSVSQEQVKSFKIVNKGEGGRPKRRQYYLFIDNQRKIIRFSFGKEIYQKYEIGDMIRISIKSNLFGFKFLEPEEWNK